MYQHRRTLGDDDDPHLSRGGEAGQPALDLVLPILAERTDLNWSWLHHAFPSAHVVLDTCAATQAALARLDPWTARGVADAISASAEACGMPRVRIEELLRFAVLQHLSPLPLAEVMQVVGQGRCLARLERVRTVFQQAQLIG